MMKPILMASALALAIPALAQTSTNDDQGAVGGAATNVAQEQPKVMAPAQSPTLTTPDTDDDENDAETTDDASVAVTDGATTTQVNAPATTQTPGSTGGTMQGHASHTGMTGSTNSATGQTGTGGPFQPARDYPVCSRTVTDSCLQMRNSPRPRR